MLRALVRAAMTAAFWCLGLVVVAWLAAGWASSPARAWSVHEMNRLIEETNFIVGQGCSGTLISLEHRLILTNYHCIAGDIRFVEKEEVAENGEVKKVRRERRERVTVTQRAYKDHEQVGSTAYVTEILLYRKARDIAVLRLVGDRLPATVFSPLLPEDQPILRGEPVWMVGNPRMLDATVTSGIVSNVNRTFRLPWADNEDVPMIQVSAPGHPGNSGGALYNDKGYLIGIPAAGYGGAETLALAIPVAEVRQVLRDNCLASIFDERADDAACRAEKDRKKGAPKEGEVLPPENAGPHGGEVASSLRILDLPAWRKWPGSRLGRLDDNGGQAR